MSLIYEVTFSSGDLAYVNASGVSDALAEAEYQFGGVAIDAWIDGEEPKQFAGNALTSGAYEE